MNGHQLSALPIAALGLVLVSATTFAQQRAQDVPARVNGEFVQRLEVERVLREAFRGRPLADEARPHAEAAALDQAINRRLVLSWLQSQKLAATDDEVRQAYAEFVKSLEFQQVELATYLEREKLTEESLRRGITWDIAWGRYLRQQLTVPAREEFFDAHRRRFDGTQVRVSHVLFGDETEDHEARIAQAAQIKREIESGQLPFAAAVAQFSTGTKDNAGDLGFLERNGAMPEPFAAAAFALEVDEVSEPVTTPFGVHLILATEIQPGKKELKDVVAAVDKAMTRDVLDKLVKELRADAKIEFTGSMPHFDPASGKLMPGR